MKMLFKMLLQNPFLFFIFSKLVKVIWEVFLPPRSLHLGFLHLSFRLFLEVSQTFLQDDGESIWHSLLGRGLVFSWALA